LNAMQFDASTFGNHEHDRDIAHLKKISAEIWSLLAVFQPRKIFSKWVQNPEKVFGIPE